MTGYNNLSDKDIRDLLKRRLLEQEGDDDLLTQKLIDMETKLAFSNEALDVPSLQKEIELFNKLQANKYSFLRWLLPAVVLLILTLVILFYKFKTQPVINESTHETGINIPPENDFPKQETNAVVLTDSAYTETRSNLIKEQKADSLIVKDTLHKEIPEKFTTGDAGIKIDYKPGRHNPKFVDAYDNIPTLSDKERETTKKFKDRMVKQILKKDKNAWSYIPMSTGTVYGETVSLYPFYISTTEVTNNQYRTFLNDLIMQGKIDEYVKAIPDTSKWISEGRALFYKLQPDSTKWLGTGATGYFEGMRKNYFWHPAYDTYPVVCVSREGAKLYCIWLTEAVNEKIKETKPESKREALYKNDIRLPQDVEWVIAAKGGHDTAHYPWTNKAGSTIGPQNVIGCYLANFCIRNYKEEVTCPNKKFPDAYTSAGTVSHDYSQTAPVMSYNSNDYNLFCLAGNVAEMVFISDKGKPGMKAGTKGGSWSSDAEHIKIEAEDEYGGITEGSIYIGFRPVFSANIIK
jgi:formylglycine-generating enzyme required for sulfatase activity